MAEGKEQISGRLREDRLSHNTIDPELMNRSFSSNNDTGDDAGESSDSTSAPDRGEVDSSQEEEPAPGEENNDLREQQAQATKQKEAQEKASEGGVASGGLGGAVSSVMGSKGGAGSPEEMLKKKAKMMIIRSLLAPVVGGCCFPSCLFMAGFLVMAAILLTVLADPMKAIGLAFEVVWGLLKSSIGAAVGFLASS